MSSAPQTKEYRTPTGEDDYYRHHSFTWPRPFTQLRARLAALRGTLPLIRPGHLGHLGHLDHLGHLGHLGRPAIPALK